MRHALLLIAAIALSACQPQAPGGQPATAPADAPAVSVTEGGATEAATPEAFMGDLDAHGTEPFWAVQIRQTQISFSTPDSNVAGPNKGWIGGGDKLVWETLVGDKPLKITLREEAGCSDGMRSCWATRPSRAARPRPRRSRARAWRRRGALDLTPCRSG